MNGNLYFCLWAVEYGLDLGMKFFFLKHNTHSFSLAAFKKNIEPSGGRITLYTNFLTINLVAKSYILCAEAREFLIFKGTFH